MAVDTPIVATMPSRSRQAAALIVFALVWALYFAISEAPNAINQSMAEAYAWGKEFQLGYNQHPPFWAWICGLWFLVFPAANWSFALLSALNSAIGLWGAWMLIGRFAEGPTRFAATALLIATPLYTVLGWGLNANIIFVSVWPWTSYFFVRTIETRKASDAIGFGLMMGAALLSKYYALILALTCLLAALRHPDRRAYFASLSPYLAIVVALIVIAPHVFWLFANGAPPLRYFGEVSHLGYVAATSNAFDTLFGSLAENAPAIALIIYAAGLPPRAALAQARARLCRADVQFLAILALAPLALSLAACLLLQSKLVTPMLQGTFALVPLLTITLLGGRGIERLAAIAGRVAIAIGALAIPVAPLVGLGWVWLSQNSKGSEPRRELAVAATALWHQKIGLPLSYVGGSYALGDATAFYSPDHPHSFESLDYSRRLWVTPQALAAKGLMTLCVVDDSDCLAATQRYVTPAASQEELTLSRKVWGREFPPFHFLVTMIPPR